MTTLRELYATLELLYPDAGAEQWDAVGVVTGDLDSVVERVLLAVDAVDATVADALETSTDVLIVHHPLLLRGVTSISEDGYKGRLLARLIRGGCALIAAHTNADVVEYGPTAAIMAGLGVHETVPIRPSAQRTDRGIGLVGDLAEPIPLEEFARRVAALMPPTVAGVRVAGDPELPVRRVACCSGAGDSLLGDSAVTGADVYVTSDLRHHPASEAREQALLRGGTPALVDVSHAASESLWLRDAATRLQAAHPGLKITLSGRNTDPWSFRVGDPEAAEAGTAEWSTR